MLVQIEGVHEILHCYCLILTLPFPRRRLRVPPLPIRSIPTPVPLQLSNSSRLQRVTTGLNASSSRNVLSPLEVDLSPENKQPTPSLKRANSVSEDSSSEMQPANGSTKNRAWVDKGKGKERASVRVKEESQAPILDYIIDTNGPHVRKRSLIHMEDS